MARKKTFKELREEKKKQILRDYQVTDLNSSDEEALDKLASAYVTLERIEKNIDRLLEFLDQDPENQDYIQGLSRLNDAASKLRSDISRFQNDLGITRKQRNQDSEEDVVNHILKIKKAARKFAQYRTTLVFCTECNNLIGMVWFKYPKQKGNQAKFVCEKCKTQVSVHPLNTKGGKYPSDYDNVPQYL